MCARIYAESLTYYKSPAEVSEIAVRISAITGLPCQNLMTTELLVFGSPSAQSPDRIEKNPSRHVGPPASRPSLGRGGADGRRPGGRGEED